MTSPTGLFVERPRKKTTSRLSSTICRRLNVPRFLMRCEPSWLAFAMLSPTQKRYSGNAFRTRPSVDVSSDGSGIDGNSRRSASPTPDEISESSGLKETSANYLLPPQVY
ncbi:unnamed protein product [Nippostrongylus brasiliensis]|uniref:Uncharacterized protein n=1 Tax=Nippostrongylus brasiliensis TaxID=27835 RepID=A0A0N4Y2M5_NIPBR|nr:unnamed protein product [Nippostrongylus brasiliensis]